MSSPARYLRETNAGTFGEDADIGTTERSSSPSRESNTEYRSNEGNLSTNLLISREISVVRNRHNVKLF